jgi:transposase
LVNARHVKNVPGRKSDVSDCQWLQQLHTYGLLEGAFRPEEPICVLRAYRRQRDHWVRYAGAPIQHMQKALNQMNVHLHPMVSDITGVTGMKMIRAIVAGERHPERLAGFRDRRCKHDEETIAKALQGNDCEEHVFALKQALNLYDVYQSQIVECDQEIERLLGQFNAQVNLDEQPLTPPRRPRKPTKNQPNFELRTGLYRMTGIDLTAIDGIDAYLALLIILEIGLVMGRWKTVKHFVSWLGLCPGNKKSGGKVLSAHSKPSANRVAAALRLAAQSLHHSQSALGAYYRRMRARLGAPKAITATAHKLARLIYAMLKEGTAYVDRGQDYYEKQYRDRFVRNLRRKARQCGVDLVPASEPAPA